MELPNQNIVFFVSLKQLTSKVKISTFIQYILKQNSMGATQNTKWIKATPERLYNAFATAEAIAAWFAPGEMTAKVHRFDFRVGGGYQMSLYYPGSDTTAKGKTSSKEDRYDAKFIELIPSEKIVQAIHFDSPDPAFSGEMIMEVTFEAQGDETKVSFTFSNIPEGIKPADNEEGTRLTLEKLEKYVR